MPSTSTPPFARTLPLIVALLAALVLLPGIWEATGLTGKDEFFLSLRTPMEMMAGDHWLVPFLDGAPRIKKPPMLYWIGRTSFEIFGPSLIAGRAIAVLFAALLAVATAAIGRRLADARTGLIAALVLLGCLGLHTEGRRLMLDVPTAAFSASALWALLVWRERAQARWLTLATLLLAAGFLTKGPVALLLAGTGVLALLATRLWALSEMHARLPVLLLHFALFLVLALPWFVVVRLLYPEAAQLAFADEVESRQFFSFTPEILAGLFNIGLPWMFIFAAAAWQRRHDSGLLRALALWFAASVLPFLFLKSFDRYLIGSLVPMSLFVALALPRLETRWPYRLGMAVALLFGGALAAFAFHFGLGGWPWLVAPAVYLVWAWGGGYRRIVHRLAAPAIYAAALMAGVFPALGINAVPEPVVELGRQRTIVFFHGPQPALLPILSGHSHRLQKLDAAAMPALAAQHALVFCEEALAPELARLASEAGYQARPMGEYRALASHGSGLRFAREGATRDDWLRAWQSRDLALLTTRIVWFEILRP